MFDLGDLRVAISHNPGSVYKKSELESAIRQLFLALKFDQANQDKESWNPLSEIIAKGDTVLLKPNWVTHFNLSGKGSLEELITHPLVIEVVLEYVVRALGGSGKITLADAPIQSCSIDDIYHQCGIKPILEKFQKENPEIEFNLIDLRKTLIKSEGKTGLKVQNQSKNPGDPAGYSLIDLKERSLLKDIDYQWQNFRVTNYNYKLLLENHNQTNHRYLVANSVLQADVVLNLPKLKCHLKAGLTASLKNLIGINGHKEYLPHHCNGSAMEGGDQYIYKSAIKRIYNQLYDQYWSSETGKSNRWLRFKLNCLTLAALTLARDPLLDGGWLGNQTVARTTIDLNNILYYYDLKTQQMQPNPVRKVFHLVDGIVAGEGNGPLRPIAKPVGVMAAGFNPLLIDTILAEMIGYQPYAIKTIQLGYGHRESKLVPKDFSGIEQISLTLNGETIQFQQLPKLNFLKPKYWQPISTSSNP